MIEGAVRELLVGDATVNGVVTGRIYPSKAVRGAELPYIIFQRVDGDHRSHLGGADNMAQIFVQIDCYAETEFAARTLQDNVRAVLHGFRGDVDLTPYSLDTVKIRGTTAQDNPNALTNRLDGSDTSVHRTSTDYAF